MVSALTQKGRCSPTKPNVNNPPIKYSNPNPPPRSRPHFLRFRNFRGLSERRNIPKRKERVECGHHSTLFVLSPVKRVSPAANSMSIGQNHYDQGLSRHKPATTWWLLITPENHCDKSHVWRVSGYSTFAVYVKGVSCTVAAHVEAGEDKRAIVPVTRGTRRASRENGLRVTGSANFASKEGTTSIAR